MREPAIRPTPDQDEKLPAIPRDAAVDICIAGLFVIALGLVLYAGKPLFMPLFAAFIVGTTLSPGAAWLKERGIPRGLGAVLIVGATFGAFFLVIGLITAPVPGLIDRAPDLAAQLRDKMHAFDRPLALLRQIETSVTGGTLTSDFRLPRIEWMQPTLEFVTPTIAELVLFLVALLLFVASWPDVRRRLILAVDDRKTRLRTMQILNAVETRLGSYLALVSLVNIVLGFCTALIALVTGMPNPAGLAALAAALNYIPIIGPVVMFIVLVVVGLLSFPTLGAGLLAATLFAALTFLEGHFLTPIIIGRRLSLNALTVFVALAFWTWLWGPMGAFLASPILIIFLILKEYLFPDDAPQLPGES